MQDVHFDSILVFMHLFRSIKIWREVLSLNYKEASVWPCNACNEVATGPLCHVRSLEKMSWNCITKIDQSTLRAAAGTGRLDHKIITTILTTTTVTTHNNGAVACFLRTAPSTPTTHFEARFLQQKCGSWH